MLRKKQVSTFMALGSGRVMGARKSVKMRRIFSAFALVAAAVLFQNMAFAELPVPSHITPPVGEHKGEHVPQPIEFPHNRHVKDMKINCMYCHTYARRSKVAGIPPTSKCMGCHSMIATDKPRIQKLTEYWEKGESPKWKKVHDVPDYVHFTHEKHIKKFVFDADFPVEDVQQVCGLCHGEVQEMTVAEKKKPLNMGFCQRCHKANGGPGDCWKCHK